MIPILECILNKNELMIYKDSIYFIFFKLSGKSFPHITTKEYNSILNVFNAVSSIYDKCKPKAGFPVMAENTHRQFLQ